MKFGGRMIDFAVKIISEKNANKMAIYIYYENYHQLISLAYIFTHDLLFLSTQYFYELLLKYSFELKITLKHTNQLMLFQV